MQRTAETQRSWTGAPLWSRGFRPFFFGAGLWAVAAIVIWLPFFTGRIAVPTAFSPIAWHVHEMFYGYGAAVIAGFLLTAIPNWTGRLPVAGRPLAFLSGLWVLGRAAVFFSATIGWMAAAVLDTAFLVVFTAFAAREVIAGKNWRNLKVAALVAVLAIANAGFHIEAATMGDVSISLRAGIAIIIFLILLIGGRVVPSFTSNWLPKHLMPRPASLGTPDRAALGLSGAALFLWIATPDWRVTGGLLLVAGVANVWRLSRWRGWATRSAPLVLVLHVGFCLAALGFFFAGAHAFAGDIVSSAVATHVWGIGGVGTMTLAMMTRATLGHTGRALTASPATQFIYLAAIAAMLARVAAEFLPVMMMPLMYGAAVAWLAAFGTFIVIYGPMFVTPRT